MNPGAPGATGAGLNPGAGGGGGGGGVEVLLLEAHLEPVVVVEVLLLEAHLELGVVVVEVLPLEAHLEPLLSIRQEEEELLPPFH